MSRARGKRPRGGLDERDHEAIVREEERRGGSRPDGGGAARRVLAPSAGAQISEGYGPLVDKGDLWLPEAFEYQVISRQGAGMSDGQPTPGIFDGMGAYPGPNGTTILIRNHENRERDGRAEGHHPARRSSTTPPPRAATRSCACAAAARRTRWSRTSRSSAAPRPTAPAACAARTSGSRARRSSSSSTARSTATSSRSTRAPTARSRPSRCPRPAGARTRPRSSARGVIYMTEDRSLESDTILGTIGSCLYRYTPEQGSRRDAAPRDERARSRR